MDDAKGTLLSLKPCARWHELVPRLAPNQGADRLTARSIATVALSGSLDEKLRAIAGAGFDAVEIFENDLLTFNGSPRDVGQLCRDLGLSICAFQPFRDFEGMPEPQRTRNFARARHKFDLMQELQTDLLLICSNVSPASLGGIDRAAADFHALGELAASHGVRVGFEALAWGRHVNDYRDAWEIVRRADHKSIGVILDSFHALAPGFPVTAIQSIPADKIFLVQLADAPKLGLDVLSWSRHFRCFPGQGDLPVAGFMEAVAATGYAGPLSLEIFNDQFRSGSAVRTATDGLRSLILLEDQLAPKVRPARRRPGCSRERVAAASDSSNSPSTKPRPGICPRCSASLAFARPVPIAARKSSAGRKAVLSWLSTVNRMVLPIRITSRTAPASARSRSTSTLPTKP